MKTPFWLNAASVSLLVVLAGCTALTQTSTLAPTATINDISSNDALLTEKLKTEGVKKAMAQLVEESGGGSVYDCHQQAHHIGRVGYSILKEKAFQQCDASCHSGCYHGAMESFLHEKGTAHLAENIKNVCTLFETRFGYFECLHGVGHGVLAYVDYDMPEAIKLCKDLGGDFEARSCFGGMFMENVLTGQGLGASKKEDHSTQWVNKTDFHFPCNALEKNTSLQDECYLMQTSWMLTISNYDFTVVNKECMKAPGAQRPSCFKSFGRDAAGHTLRNTDKIIELCTTVPREADYYEQCIMGGLNVIVDFWGPNLKDQATMLCKKLNDPVGKKTCYETLSWRVADIFQETDERSRLCDTFESEYKPICTQRAAQKIEVAPQLSVSPGPQTAELVENTRTPKIYTIEMYDSFYAPAALTIRKGDTVLFINKANAAHLPASNIHPTHQIYPEFDPKKAIEPNGSWSFVFDKNGSWRYHDHLFPEIIGVIEVTD